MYVGGASKYPNKRNIIEFVSLYALVPEDYLLCKIDSAINFDRIYDFVEDLYREDNGRPSVNPVILFKIVLIRHIYGIPYLRRTLEEINMNMCSTGSSIPWQKKVILMQKPSLLTAHILKPAPIQKSKESCAETNKTLCQRTVGRSQ